MSLRSGKLPLLGSEDEFFYHTGCGYGGESFTLSTGEVTTPEPSSILLLGSGILGLAGVLRRKAEPVMPNNSK